MSELNLLPVRMIHDRLLDLSKKERAITAELIEYLSQMSSRMLYVELGYSSLFDYVTKALGYSESSALRRIQAARLLKTMPTIKQDIISGDLKLTQASELYNTLRKVEKETHQKVEPKIKKELLCKIKNQTQRMTQSILNETFDIKAVAHTKTEIKKDRVYEVAMSFTEDEFVMLEKVKSHLSHSVPNKDTKELILYLAKKALINFEASESKIKKQNLSINQNTNLEYLNSNQELQDQPLSQLKTLPSNTNENSNRKSIPTRLRRQKFFESGHQCEWENSDSAARCQQRSFLEIDHIKPKVFNGSNDSSNLRVLCRQHNQYSALKDGILR